MLTTTGLIVVLLASVASALPEGFKKELLLSGMGDVTDLEFLPDGRVLAAERMGVINIFDPSDPGHMKVYLDLSGMVDMTGEKGLLDIALDPEWDQGEEYVYAYVSVVHQSFKVLRFSHVERGGVNSHADVYSQKELWSDPDGYYGISYMHWHYGGAIAFGPDNMLYVTQGDKTVEYWVQRDDYHKAAGCIIRIYKNGQVPNNPFAKDRKVPGCWVKGLRNGYRAFWDTQSDRFFVAEVGGNNQKTAWEDLHILDSKSGGENLGWPYCEGKCGHPDFPKCSCDYHQPAYTYDHSGQKAAIIGGFLNRNSALPSEYDGGYFFGDYARGIIKYLKFRGDSATVESDHLFDDVAYGIISLVQSPNGVIYYTTITGEIVVITPPGGSKTPSEPKSSKNDKTNHNNSPPDVYHVKADVTSGPAPLTVTFKGYVSDADGDDIEWKWTVEGDTIAKGDNPTYTFDTPGKYQVIAKASDGTDKDKGEPITITVLEDAHITDPHQFTIGYDGDLLEAGDRADFYLEGKLPNHASITWSFRIGDTGSPVEAKGSEVTYKVPKSDKRGAELNGGVFAKKKNAFLHVTVTVNGEKKTIQVGLRTRTVELSSKFDTTMTVNRVEIQAPSKFHGIVGFAYTLRAESTTCFNNQRFPFKMFKVSDNEGSEKVKDTKASLKLSSDTKVTLKHFSAVSDC